MITIKNINKGYMLGEERLPILKDVCFKVEKGEYVGLLLLGEAIPWDTDPVEMQNEPFYRLMGFVIDKKYRSNGLGGEILEKAIDEVYKDFGKRSIALGCHKDNTRAANFYLKHGFERTGVFEGNDEYFLRIIQK